jgi:hypothetical protein
MFKVLAICWRLPTLGSQLATMQAKCSRRSSISGWRSKASKTTASSFLLQAARRKPRRRYPSSAAWKSLKALPG